MEIRKVQSLDGYGNFMNTANEIQPTLYFPNDLSGLSNILATKIRSCNRSDYKEWNSLLFLLPLYSKCCFYRETQLNNIFKGGKGSIFYNASFSDK